MCFSLGIFIHSTISKNIKKLISLPNNSTSTDLQLGDGINKYFQSICHLITTSILKTFILNKTYRKSFSLPATPFGAILILTDLILLTNYRRVKLNLALLLFIWWSFNLTLYKLTPLNVYWFFKIKSNNPLIKIN